MLEKLMANTGSNPEELQNVVKYEQVIDNIIRNIQNGIFQDGLSLPSERIIAQNMNVSLVTVRQALAQLCDRGVIIKQQGRRSIVNASALHGRKRELRYGWITRDPFIGITPIYLEIFTRLQRSMMAVNAQLLFLPMINQQEKDWISSILNSLDGLFLAGIEASLITHDFNKRLRSIPNVIEIDEIGDSPAAYNICTDNYAAGRMAAEYLIENNRNVLACFDKHSLHYQAFRERAQGLFDYYAENKMSLPHYNCLAKDIGTENGNAEILAILKENPHIDTVWHPMDLHAINIRHNLEEIAPRGLGYYYSIGTDGVVSIIKNEKFHATLAQPVEKIAQHAFQTMIDFASGQRSEMYRDMIPPELLPWKCGKEVNIADAV